MCDGLRDEANGEIEAAIAFDDLCDGGAADGRLYGIVDVCRGDPIACGFGAIDG